MTLRTKSVTLITPALVTDRGVSVPDWGNATETVIQGCRWQPMVSDEETAQHRQGVVKRLNFFGPPDMALTAHSRVEVEGEVYEVEGSVRPWMSPSGNLDHIEAHLMRAEG
jgi:hypothetical protein